MSAPIGEWRPAKCRYCGNDTEMVLVSRAIIKKVKRDWSNFFTGQELREWLRTAPYEGDVYEHMARHYNPIIEAHVRSLRQALKEAREINEWFTEQVDRRELRLSRAYCLFKKWLEKWGEG